MVVVVGFKMSPSSPDQEQLIRVHYFELPKFDFQIISGTKNRGGTGPYKLQVLVKNGRAL